MFQMDVEAVQTPNDGAAMGQARFAVSTLRTLDDLGHPLEFPRSDLTTLPHAGQGRTRGQHQLAQ
jgi:hypothetical protein